MKVDTGGKDESSQNKVCLVSCGSPFVLINVYLSFQAAMPIPKFIVDPNDPIYKQGDPNQEGEEGKGVKIDKNVFFEFG